MEKSWKNLRVALVHDFLNQLGGAERALEVLMGMFPEAPVYTLLYDEEKTRGRFSKREIRTSFLQNFPGFLRNKPARLLPFLPSAPETFDLRDFDLVISSSGAWSKGIVTKLDTIHIAYLHSPMRFAWDYSERYLKERRKEKCAFLARPFLNYLRVWDALAADRPDVIVSNSVYTSQRVKKYYRKDSEVVYPPVEIPGNFFPESGEVFSEKYFLIVSRLSAYKKVFEAVEAFNKLGLPLKVAGEGPEFSRIKKIAGKNVSLLGWKKDDELKKLYAGARAFVFPSLDDFGIAPVEAMKFGVPVLALGRGGALETVIPGKTGEFFESCVPEMICDAVRRFSEKEKIYDRRFIREHAGKFSRKRFQEDMERIIEKVLREKLFEITKID